MNVEKIILDLLNKNGKVTSREIIEKTGFSREYINRHFQNLAGEKKIILIGKANQAHYLPFTNKNLSLIKQVYRRTFERIKFDEDHALKLIRNQNIILRNLPKNVDKIFAYTFSEMANNAIDHSKAKTVKVGIDRDQKSIKFYIADNGIGIYNNLIEKKHLKNELEAIQTLLKGKQTTDPDKHSGQGIFFTSKIADIFIIESSKKRLIINNKIGDIFIEDIPSLKGTTVKFQLNLPSQKDLTNLFKEYSGDDFAFDKTQITIELFKTSELLISRSQAKKIMHDLEKFRIIVLDFKNIDTVGQAFCDEIFRVWQKTNPEIRIEYINTNENTDFMIKRALV